MHDAKASDDERDQYFGLSLRELVHTFKWQTLVLLKGLILQPKVCPQDGLHLDALELTASDALLWITL